MMGGNVDNQAAPSLCPRCGITHRDAPERNRSDALCTDCRTTYGTGWAQQKGCACADGRRHTWRRDLGQWDQLAKMLEARAHERAFIAAVARSHACLTAGLTRFALHTLPPKWRTCEFAKKGRCHVPEHNLGRTTR